jgi:uncharacterized cofD-like protein
VGNRIERLFLEPEGCQPMPIALAAIEKADVITVGPGSLFTSLLPPLLVQGVGEAIARSQSLKIFVCNLMTQPGETDGMTSRRHLEVVKEYAPDVTFDVIVVNNSPISEVQAAMYNVEGAEQIGVHGSIEETAADGTRIVFADLLERGEKVRHDPEKLARMVLALAEERLRSNLR